MAFQILLEQKNIFLNHIKTILVPVMQRGFETIYQDSIDINKTGKDQNKVLVIFQTMIKKIPDWNKNLINKEVLRIKDISKTHEYFEKLIKATFKVYFKIIIGTKSALEPKFTDFAEKIEIDNFVHRCYINASKLLYTSCNLMYHNYQPIEIKKNQLLIKEILSHSIEDAFIALMPISNLIDAMNTNIIDDTDLMTKMLSSVDEIKNNFTQKIHQMPSLEINPIIHEPMISLPLANQPQGLQITTDGVLPREQQVENKLELKENEISPDMLHLDKLTASKGIEKKIDYQDTSEEHILIPPVGKVLSDKKVLSNGKEQLVGILPNQGLPSQVLPNQVLPNQVLPSQGLPSQVLPNQGLPNQVLPNQVGVLPNSLVEGLSNSKLSQNNSIGAKPYLKGNDSFKSFIDDNYSNNYAEEYNNNEDVSKKQSGEISVIKY